MEENNKSMYLHYPLVVNILSYCTPNQLMHVTGLVSKKWNELSFCDEVWEHKVKLLKRNMSLSFVDSAKENWKLYRNSTDIYYSAIEYLNLVRPLIREVRNIAKKWETPRPTSYFTYPTFDAILPIMPAPMLSKLCKRVKSFLVYEPQLLHLCSPISVVGDIHGNLHGLLTIFASEGLPPKTSFLFLGDMISRGYYSVEVMTILFCLKLLYPQNIFMLRGQHETRQMSQVYGFYDELLAKYHVTYLWQNFCAAFDNLPLAAIIDRKIFSVHSGIGVHLESLEMINKVPKAEPPFEGSVVVDLLYAEPEDDIAGYSYQSRGPSLNFGEDITTAFLKKYNFSLILRSLPICPLGFMWNHHKKCLTVFSSANYCYRCENLAAVARVYDARNILVVQLGALEPSREVLDARDVYNV